MRSILLVLICAALSYAGPITYNVSRTVGAATVSGTVTTDGTLGTLAGSNFTDWSLSIVNGSNSDVLAPGGANRVYVVGGYLTATATDLSFNFTGDGTGCLLFQNSLSAATNWWGVSQGPTCLGPTREEIRFLGFRGVYDFRQFVNYSGTQVIATGGQAAAAATPEPSTLVLAFGALLGFSAWRRTALRTARR